MEINCTKALLKGQSFYKIPVNVVHFTRGSKIIHAPFDQNTTPVFF